ncbi:MAG: prepilin-type N-terminal cleavage/methylation domain-containing protein [Verrucomicrobia bacterium]|nr:prepilin-type N-terminal cleavage/methylation domain-containing protein [Verrucomicrobiota bacterium]
MKKCQPSQVDAGFSLVEVSMALAIGALAMVSLISVLPQLMKYERESADLSVVGMIMEDIHSRLEGQDFKEGVPSISPIFYDQRGRHWAPSKDNELSEVDLSRDEKFFRGDIKLVNGADSSTSSNSSLVIKIDFFWPVDKAGNPLGKQKEKTSVTYYTTTLTGPDWGSIDPNFQSKIEY